ncbi:MAG: hypothetical protein IKN73_00550 [Alphaproteobacteria bacterium]|nr:hypothetical protein [Alphaproteobacteria bacterium]
MNKITIFLLLLFIVQTPVFADELSCKTGMQDLMALFTPKTINCNDNQFLPANSVTCSNCPNGYTCPGGDLIFNETKSSGIDYRQKITTSANNVCSQNFPKMLYANFKIAQRNCDPGYYLPANSVSCTICSADHYCPGGQLTFNETAPQGIIECPSAHPFAPVGMWLESQCGRKLHVGNDVIYMHQQPAHPTTHRLFIQYGNTVYSANAKPKEFGIDDIKMSFGAENSLHVILDGIEYLVYDDSLE